MAISLDILAMNKLLVFIPAPVVYERKLGELEKGDGKPRVQMSIYFHND